MSGTLMGFKAAAVEWLKHHPRGATTREAFEHFERSGGYTKQHVSNSLNELAAAGILHAVREPFGKAQQQRRYFHPDHKPAENLVPIGGNPIVRAGVAVPGLTKRVLDTRTAVTGPLPKAIVCPASQDLRFAPDQVRGHFGDLRPGQYDADSGSRWAAQITGSRR